MVRVLNNYVTKVKKKLKKECLCGLFVRKIAFSDLIQCLS